MRVVLVVEEFPTLLEPFTVSRVIGLLRRGHDVFVICNRHSQRNWASFVDIDKMEIARRVRINRPNRPRWHLPLFLPVLLLWTFLRNAHSTKRYLFEGWRRYGFDVLRRFYSDAQFIALNPDIVHFESIALVVGRTDLKSSL